MNSLEVSLNVWLEVPSMARLAKIIPISELRQDAAAVLKQLQASQEPLVITQRGRATAVILSVRAYERAERERELMHLIARGEHEIAAGTGYELDEVMAEADGLLAHEPL
jgi:prevent-host-death family protein